MFDIAKIAIVTKDIGFIASKFLASLVCSANTNKCKINKHTSWDRLVPKSEKLRLYYFIPTY